MVVGDIELRVIAGRQSVQLPQARVDAAWLQLLASNWIGMKTSIRQTLTVVITGASAGLGRAIAQEFGKTGARSWGRRL